VKEKIDRKTKERLGKNDLITDREWSLEKLLILA
jgi:hypothetical protein